MAGNEVFKFGVRAMADATVEVIGKAGLAPCDIDLLVPHQANVRIMDAAARRLGIPAERVVSDVHRCGNTSAASIPIALDEARRQQRVKDGDTMVFVGFGAGLTWAAAVLRWGNTPGMAHPEDATAGPRRRREAPSDTPPPEPAIVMSKIAFLFPGQGAQRVGMGQDLYEAFPAVRRWLEAAGPPPA